MELTNKEVQKLRMMSYFIKAAINIIDNEGIEKLTIRKVSKIAGYNSATIYNYFENLNHLSFYCSIRYLTLYAKELPKCLDKATDDLDKCIQVWKCFSKHSYENPKIYNTIFFSGLSSDVINKSIKTYYDIFPDELDIGDFAYMPMLLEDSIYERDYILLKDALSKRNVSIENIRHINEMDILIYRGMLSAMEVNIPKMTVNEAVEKTITYIKQSMRSYGVEI